MLYLLDANVFIDAERNYYSLNRVPEFWDWLIHMADIGKIKTPQDIFDEVTAGKIERGRDALVDWMKENKNVLLLDEISPFEMISKVLERGYASDLNDEEIEKIGRDPFLIAHALSDVEYRCVVTTEQSKPRRIRANRHIPDVCDDLGVACVNTFELIRRLNFRTDWRSA